MEVAKFKNCLRRTNMFGNIFKCIHFVSYIKKYTKRILIFNQNFIGPELNLNFGQFNANYKYRIFILVIIL